MSDERIDIRKICGDADPLEFAIGWLGSRQHREVEAAIVYLLSDADRAEAALLAELAARRRPDRVARALAYLGRETSVPGLIAALDVGTETQRLAAQAALISIGSDQAVAALTKRGLRATPPD